MGVEGIDNKGDPFPDQGSGVGIDLHLRGIGNLFYRNDHVFQAVMLFHFLHPAPWRRTWGRKGFVEPLRRFACPARSRKAMKIDSIDFLVRILVFQMKRNDIKSHLTYEM